MFYGAQFFEGRSALNPVSFSFVKKTFLCIIFSVIFKSVQTSTCWQKKLFTSEFKFRTNTPRLGYLNPALNKMQTVDKVLVVIINFI